MNPVNLFWSVVVCAVAFAVAGCDASPTTESAPVGAPPPAGLSPIDGQPISHVRAADFDDDAFGRELRAALVDRSETLIAAVAAKRQAPDDAVLLRDVLADAPSKTGAAAPSSHIVITDGTHQQFLLTLEHPTSHAAKSSGDTYVVLDPDVFHPDSNPDGESSVRTVPGTNLATGDDVEIVAMDGVATVDGELVEDILVVGVVPVVDVATTSLKPPPCDMSDPIRCGGSTGGGGTTGGGTTGGGDNDGGGTTAVEFYGSHPFLGLRRLRIDERHDGGAFPWSHKQEVQLTAEVGDSYSAPFGRENTRRFDKAFWTNLDDWGIFPPGAQGVQSTVNPVLANYVPLAGGELLLSDMIWFFAVDVNYAEEDYDFSGRRYELCQYSVLGSCTTSEETYDFPITFLRSGLPQQRSVMNEDDFNVDHFSRRSGEDFEGPVRTYSFASGQQADVVTRIDADNHAVVTDDRVFANSGLRGMTLNSVQNRIGPDGTTLNVNGLRWELTYDVLDIVEP